MTTSTQVLDLATAPAVRQTLPGRETPIVQAERLGKRSGEVVAVDDLSFALGRGSVTGFLGPNGAGKTTTLRMLLDHKKPANRTVVLVG